MADPAGPRLSKTAIILGVCTLATVVYASHLYLFHVIRGDPVTFVESLADSASDWYSWAIVAPFILQLGRRFSFHRRNWITPMVLHIFAALLFSALHILLHAFFDQLLIHHTISSTRIAAAFISFFARTFHFGLLVYWLIVIAANLAEYYKDQALRASEIETRLARAQLNSLKMQLHPHFLFNTLHAISALIQEDPKTAQTMLARLSELLRVSLRSGNLHEVPLREEMKVLDLYLDIERIRFHDRLTVQTDIEPETMNAYVPNLILQPLVENSIHHGIAKHRGQGRVEVSARKTGDRLMISVFDNGKSARTEIQEGVGLSNTRARLQQLYGANQKFELSFVDGNGVRVTIEIPYRPAE